MMDPHTVSSELYDALKSVHIDPDKFLTVLQQHKREVDTIHNSTGGQLYQLLGDNNVPSVWQSPDNETHMIVSATSDLDTDETTSTNADVKGICITDPAVSRIEYYPCHIRVYGDEDPLLQVVEDYKNA